MDRQGTRAMTQIRSANRPTTPAGSAPGWRLHRIRLRDFRGAAGEIALELDGRPVLLTGRNGVGKSTMALGLQWALFGTFPEGVLSRTNFDTHLLPVGTKASTYEVEVTLLRGNERLYVLRRRASAKLSDLTVEIGSEAFSGAEAQAALERALGLDESTFARASLLLQNRVRGLLLDDPRERSEAMDRFLGMDEVTGLAAILEPATFADVAEKVLEEAKRDIEESETRKKVLEEQLRNARDGAASKGFRSRDANPTGLRKEIERVAALVATLAARHGTTIAPIPSASRSADAAKSLAAIRAALSRIRTTAGIGKDLTEVQTKRARLETLKNRWLTADADAKRALELLDALQRTRGDRKTILTERATAENALETARAARKATGDLAALLGDALRFVERRLPEDCPVCERPLHPAADLSARLRERATVASNDEIRAADDAIAAAQAKLDEMDEILRQIDRAVRASESARNATATIRKDLADELGAGVRDDKALSQVDGALEQTVAVEKTLHERSDKLESEIAVVDAAARRVSDALLPAISKREELAQHEIEATRIVAKHASATKRATRIEQYGEAIAQIRRAILGAKEALATEALATAGPAAQAIYGELVQNRVFDTLDVGMKPTRGKVDYRFAVNQGGDSKTSREARYVLSDGQLTCAALALFFAFSGAGGHSLDFVFVDDPTQSLDLEAKAAMAKVVTRLASERQVVIATHDEDFEHELESAGFFDVSIVHTLTDWQGSPTVSTRMPREACA